MSKKSKKNLNHLAIIPDGNSRWAKANKLAATKGYSAGFDRIVELSRAVRELGVHTLTFWGLSTENWAYRPQAELDFIFDLVINASDKLLEDAQEDGVRIMHLGRRDRLPKRVIDKIEEFEEKTKDNTNYVLNLALDYGGVDEIVRAAKKLAEDVASGKVSSEDVDKIEGDESAKLKHYSFYKYLDTADQPYPFVDYVIRTSGEIRLSGFLPLQAAYAELYFEECLFPDFDPEKLKIAVDSYFNRERRFGGGH